MPQDWFNRFFHLITSLWWFYLSISGNFFFWIEIQSFFAEFSKKSGVRGNHDFRNYLGKKVLLSWPEMRWRGFGLGEGGLLGRGRGKPCCSPIEGKPRGCHKTGLSEYFREKISNWNFPRKKIGIKGSKIFFSKCHPKKKIPKHLSLNRILKND